MSKVDTAEDAVKIAAGFLEAYGHRFKKLYEVSKENSSWTVTFDVGAILQEYVRIKLDAATGKVLEIKRSPLPQV